LRGSTRLANRLLFCITSITPRARYFSFLPWCVHDYRRNERGRPSALGLREAIRLREHALALGCVAHHGGRTCTGGGVVGSDRAIAWLGGGAGTADLAEILARGPFTKNPALDAYFNSLANLGLFVADEEHPDGEEGEEAVERSFDDVELSPLGEELASLYGSAVAGVAAVPALSPPRRPAGIDELAALGEHGGLCELASTDAPDRGLLRDLFFRRRPLKSRAHRVRRLSLLLALELARRCEETGSSLDEDAFAMAVYYGEIPDGDEARPIDLPAALEDIRLRWRMFYFHHYAAVALESMFSWLSAALHEHGLAGTTLEKVVGPLHAGGIGRSLSEQLSIQVPDRFGASSPRDLFAAVGVDPDRLDGATSRSLDNIVRPGSGLGEQHLERLLRGNGFLQSPDALPVALVLLATTLGRFERWRGGNYGAWLASIAIDPYIDVVPPVLAEGLVRRFGDWWGTSWGDLAQFVLFRYVAQQHRSIAYEKTATGDRCIIEADGATFWATGEYGRIGMGNPRLRSALQVLADLGLLASGPDGGVVPTGEGRRFLEDLLGEEATVELP
jgi:hypothetical protein